MPDCLAERVGFEPTVRLPVLLISSQAHSTTLAPLLKTFSNAMRSTTETRVGLIRAIHGANPAGALRASKSAILPICRTHGTVARTLDFESSPFDHSGSSPGKRARARGAKSTGLPGLIPCAGEFGWRGKRAVALPDPGNFPRKATTIDNLLFFSLFLYRTAVLAGSLLVDARERIG